MSDPTTSIEPTPDGPLKVSGAIDLTNSRGEAVTTQGTYWLCRCGGSGNKPFCDGSHKKIGFESERLSDPAKRATRTYAGKQLAIHDNRSICAHAGYCTEHSPDVFSMEAKPWINANADQAESTIATINMCPSGALAYQTGEVAHEHSGREPAIEITKDGPYAVVGGPQLGGDAEPVSKEHYTLCRCGRSKNKPFCDGAHWSTGFKDNKN